MASGADYISLRMTGTVYVCPAEILSMAAKAIVESLLWTEFGEGDDCGLAAACFEMRLSRSMAAFATVILRRAISCRDTFKVRIFIEIQPDIRVTCAADVSTDVTRLRRLRCCRSRGWRSRL